MCTHFTEPATFKGYHRTFGVLSALVQVRDTDNGVHYARGGALWEAVRAYSRQIGVGCRWIARPADPLDSCYLWPEDEAYAVLVLGGPGQVKGFLRKAGREVGQPYALFYSEDEEELSLLPTSKEQEREQGKRLYSIGMGVETSAATLLSLLAAQSPVYESVPQGFKVVGQLGNVYFRDQPGWMAGFSRQARKRAAEENLDAAAPGDESCR